VQNAATVGNTSQKEQVSSMGATKAEKLEQEGRGLFLVPDYHLPDEVKEDIGMPNSKVAEITYSNGRRHLYAVKEERDDSGELHKKLEHVTHILERYGDEIIRAHGYNPNLPRDAAMNDPRRYLGHYPQSGTVQNEGVGTNLPQEDLSMPDYPDYSQSRIFDGDPDLPSSYVAVNNIFPVRELMDNRLITNSVDTPGSPTPNPAGVPPGPAAGEPTRRRGSGGGFGEPPEPPGPIENTKRKRRFSRLRDWWRHRKSKNEDNSVAPPIPRVVRGRRPVAQTRLAGNRPVKVESERDTRRRRAAAVVGGLALAGAGMAVGYYIAKHTGQDHGDVINNNKEQISELRSQINLLSDDLRERSANLMGQIGDMKKSLASDQLAHERLTKQGHKIQSLLQKMREQKAGAGISSNIPAPHISPGSVKGAHFEFPWDWANRLWGHRSGVNPEHVLHQLGRAAAKDGHSVQWLHPGTHGSRVEELKVDGTYNTNYIQEIFRRYIPNR
jgi:hypothetical protein